MRVVVGVLIAGLAGAACRESGTPPPVPVGSDSCRVTLSGAMTGAYDCTPVATAWASSGDAGVFSFFVAPVATTPDVEAIIAWSGEPHAGHYLSAAAGAGGGAGVTTADSRAWSAMAGGAGPRGSYDLAFTSVTYAQTIPTGKLYAAHGTLRATLSAEASTGALGDITMMVTF
jgi:hypothetical protein